jgi:hypothetical protein
LEHLVLELRNTATRQGTDLQMGTTAGAIKGKKKENYFLAFANWQVT